MGKGLVLFSILISVFASQGVYADWMEQQTLDSSPWITCVEFDQGHDSVWGQFEKVMCPGEIEIAMVDTTTHAYTIHFTKRAQELSLQRDIPIDARFICKSVRFERPKLYGLLGYEVRFAITDCDLKQGVNYPRGSVRFG